MEERRTRKLDGLPKPFLASLEKRHGKINFEKDFVSIDLDNYYKYVGTDKQTGQVSHNVIALPSFKNLYLHYEDLVQDVKELQGKEGVREDRRARELFELIKTNFRKLQRYLREERPEQYQAVRTKYNETAIESLTTESLRDWFKKEKWVRISSSGNIAGDCGTSKNKKNPDRCLPKAKAQSLSKAERAATARKKKKAGKKGKTVVKNTKKAKVTRENLEKLVWEVVTEKDDRCTRRAKREFDTWPSAYASGAVVRCRQGKIWKKK